MSTVELRRRPAEKVRRLRKILDALKGKESKARTYERILADWKKNCTLVFGGLF